MKTAMTVTELIEKHGEEFRYPTDSFEAHLQQFAIELLELVKAKQSEVFTKPDAVIEARVVHGLHASIDKALEELRK